MTLVIELNSPEAVLDPLTKMLRTGLPDLLINPQVLPVFSDILAKEDLRVIWNYSIEVWNEEQADKSDIPYLQMA